MNDGTELFGPAQVETFTIVDFDTAPITVEDWAFWRQWVDRMAFELNERLDDAIRAFRAPVGGLWRISTEQDGAIWQSPPIETMGVDATILDRNEARRRQVLQRVLASPRYTDEQKRVAQELLNPMAEQPKPSAFDAFAEQWDVL